MKPHVKTICKIGQGHECCRYLVMGASGFECAKLTSLRRNLDLRVFNKTIHARGDNCDGYDQDKSITELNEKL